MKIVVSGISGKMGSLVAQHIEEDAELKLVAGVDRKKGYKIVNSYVDLPETDVIIDFSTANSLINLLHYAKIKKIPLVIATTGHTKNQILQIEEASKQIPIFYSANLSFGVQLVKSILKQYASLLETDFDTEIIEKHHNEKIDAPSGTALMLAKTIKDASTGERSIVLGHDQKRETGDIAIHAIRGGNIVGEHTVIFAGTDEIIELTHIAHSKIIFVKGALRAARFIVKKKTGLYSMEDLVK